MLKRWSSPGGYRDVFRIGLPLVASMASTTIMEFTDRVFLGSYSLDAIAAALPAGITSFLIMCFFMGVVNYVNVFVAQYTGAGEKQKVGAAIWQGIYCAAIGGFVLACCWFLAEPLFRLGGHAPEVQRLEATYFRILSLGGILGLTSMALSCFFTGRGLTRPVMLVHMAAATLNIPLDYALINGVGFFPELGIAGAALATVTSWGFGMAAFAWLTFTKENNRRFSVWNSRQLDRELFGRLLKYGLPGGVQFFLEIFSITFFIFMTGRLGKVELAASNIALNISSLAFLPMIGFHVAISTMVGQAIGRKKPEDGAYAVTSALHLTMIYMAFVISVFLMIPEFLIDLFRPREAGAIDFVKVAATGVVLLRFVSVFTFFDAMNLIFCGAIKGAGDTRFVMWTLFFISIILMVVPVYLALEMFHADLYTIWVLATIFISSLGIVFWWRYRGGKWKEMSVI